MATSHQLTQPPDSPRRYTQSEDVGARYEAYGWDVETVDGHDLVAVEKAIATAKSNNNGKPTLIICRTVIGKGIEEIEGTNVAHGEGGVKYVDGARKKLGLPEEKWFVSDGTRDFFKGVQAKNKKIYDEWQGTYKAWKAANGDLATALENGLAKKVSQG